MELTLFKWALASATTIILGLIGLVFNLLRNNNKITTEKTDAKVKNLEEKLSLDISSQVRHLSNTFGLKFDHVHEQLDEFEKHQNDFRKIRHEDRDLISRIAPQVEVISDDYKDFIKIQGETINRMSTKLEKNDTHIQLMHDVNKELKSFIREKVK